MTPVIREIGSGDEIACRALWADLTEYHRRLYDDPTIGGDDPGRGFDEYLSMPTRLRSWVAIVDASVVGLAGLLGRGSHAEIEPVIVASSWRRQGVGRALIDRCLHEATIQGFGYASIRPVARNVAAIHAFYQAGFHTLGGHIDLTIDLSQRRHSWNDGVTLHGLPLLY